MYSESKLPTINNIKKKYVIGTVIEKLYEEQSRYANQLSW
jgi:hypothetical protein